MFSSPAGMGFSQEILISKCENTLQSNHFENALTATSSSSPKRAQKDDTGSVFWAQVNEMVKVHNSELDDDYTFCQKMVNTYLSETNAPQQIAHCNTGRRKRQCGHYFHTWCKSTWHKVLDTKVLGTSLYHCSFRKTVQHTADNIVTDKRTRLDGNKIEMLLFLNKNIHLKEDD